LQLNHDNSHLEDQGVNGGTIKTHFGEIGCEDVNWVEFSDGSNGPSHSTTRKCHGQMINQKSICLWTM